MRTSASTMLRKSAVIARTGLSSATIDRQEARGQFPARVTLSQYTVGWVEAEIEAWLMARIEARNMDARVGTGRASKRNPQHRESRAGL